MIKNIEFKDVAILLILIGAFMRLIPHPPNFTPILAISIFAGMKFKNSYYSYIIPILSMFISDIFIGIHYGMFVIYPLLLITVLVGRNFKNINSSSIVSCILFFVITNFQVWVVSGMYGHDILGLIQCYIAAIPFFGMTLVSTFIYSYSLFLSFELLTKIPMRKQV